MKNEISLTAGGTAARPLWTRDFKKKLQLHLLYDPVIPILGI